MILLAGLALLGQAVAMASQLVREQLITGEFFWAQNVNGKLLYSVPILGWCFVLACFLPSIFLIFRFRDFALLEMQNEARIASSNLLFASACILVMGQLVSLGTGPSLEELDTFQWTYLITTVIMVALIGLQAVSHCRRTLRELNRVRTR